MTLALALADLRVSTVRGMNSNHSHAEGRHVHAKQSLRRSMHRTREGIALARARALTRAASGHLMEFIAARGPSIVGMYAARGRELGTAEVAAALRGQGVILAYPRVVRGQPALAFHRVDEPWNLEVGSFGIAEPEPSAAAIDVASIELFVVPGLAFDGEGYRLGWGKGYYDATLSRSGGLRVGYGYGFQLVERVPRAAHDVMMDVLVNEDGIVTTVPPEPAGPERGRAAAPTRSNE